MFPFGTVVEREEVDSDVAVKRTASDPKADILKLFSHMKTSRHDGDKSAKPRPWRESKGLRNPFAATVSHPLREVVIDVLKELNAWKTLHDFCKDLWIFRKLGEEKTFLSVCVAEAGKDGPLDTLIERCGMCVCLVCVCLQLKYQVRLFAVFDLAFYCKQYCCVFNTMWVLFNCSHDAPTQTCTTSCPLNYSALNLET